MITIRFVKTGVDRDQTSSTVQTTRAVLMWQGEPEIYHVFKK